MGDHPTAYGSLGDLHGIDATAVVGDLHDHLAALVAGLQVQVALGRLALRDAFGWGLDAVVEVIADHVRQWVAEGFETRAVELVVVARPCEDGLRASMAG